MPKFNGQNKRKKDPRYFLDESQEGWDKYDDLMAKAGASGEEWQAPWNSPGDMLDHLVDQAREASKAAYGYKVDVEGMTLAQLRDLIHSAGTSDVQKHMDKEDQRQDDAAVGMQDDEYENLPKNLGMGRMEELIRRESVS